MTYDFLANEQAFEKFVEEFENGTLPRPSWTHAAHLSIGAWYLLTFPPETATGRVREGIRHYNECVGIANTPDSGYHETLTRFWIGILVSNLPDASRRLAVPRETHRDSRRGGKIRVMSVTSLRHYYSFDVVASREARARWIPPDRIV